MNHLVGAPERLTDSEFAALRTLIRRAAGIHLADSKRELVASRLARRLRHHGFRRYGAYYDHVTRHDPRGEELRELVNCITTNKTSFFREPHHFDYLRRTLLAPASAGRELRFWSAGCSTGEEPYTLALVARDALGAEAAARRVRIFGSDIDTRVLETARQGLYDEARLDDVPPHLRRLGFLRGTGRQAGRVLVRPELRQLLEFQRVNLTDPATWPTGRRFHAIFCRNVIIYFDAETRRALIARFAEHLEAGGLLLLGHSESLHDQDLFEAVGTTIYRLRTGSRQVSAPPPGAGEGLVPAAASKAGEGLVCLTSAPGGEHGTTPGGGPAVGAGKAAASSAPLGPPLVLPLTVIHAGGLGASAAPAEIRTLVGSCICVCLHDPESRVGGMNHFLLPDLAGDVASSARYGVHAMELLINRIMQLGGERRRLQAKCFGGAAVLGLSDASPQVGRANVAFIRRFLAQEGIPLLGERLGGSLALEVRLETHTGRVRVRPVGGACAARAEQENRRYLRELAARTAAPRRRDVTLFR